MNPIPKPLMPISASTPATSPMAIPPAFPVNWLVNGLKSVVALEELYEDVFGYEESDVEG